METNQAAENLQVIRTLMERSALYRRALAPVTLFVGTMGGIAMVVGLIQPGVGFLQLWMTTACVSLVGALLLIRRQALKASEPFWTPPTRRIAVAVSPAFLAGAVISLILFATKAGTKFGVPLIPSLWLAFYGCGLHAAGAFMPRGIKWLGWIFILASLTQTISMVSAGFVPFGSGFDHFHIVMGAGFGGLHLAYGIYLYFTEPRKNVA